MQPVKKKNTNSRVTESGALQNTSLVDMVKPSQWRHNYYFPLFLIILISIIVYLPILQNGFVNWDDDRYIYQNSMIQSINLKEIFSSYVIGNYHPLTMLTYAIEYHFFGLNATVYHAFSLLLHLFNTSLVFYIILNITKKTEVALIVSLLFGIHPLHVESVAWASELKDLLYAFFFLFSFYLYLLYIKYSKKNYYLISIVLFLLSLLSKGMAASLPLVLVLSDYFIGRKFNSKVWVEKIPYFVLALIFGIVAIAAQKSENAINSTSFSLIQRMLFACYGFIIYLVKLILPLQLSSFYPYPVKSGEPIPVYYYVFPLLIIGLLIAVIFSMKRSKKIVFGLGFFTITVFLVLQLLALGQSIIAERYVYLPCIGIFYLIAEFIYGLWKNKQFAQRLAGSIIIGVALLFFSVKTYARCGVWKDGMALWNDVISKYPQVPDAYLNRGGIYMGQKKYDAALSDFSKAIELKPNYSSAFNNRAILYEALKKFPEARGDYDHAITFKPDFFEAYDNRGMLSTNENKYEEALADFNKSIELNPRFIDAYNNKAVVLSKLNRNQEALDALNTALMLDPGNSVAAKNRSQLSSSEKRSSEAINSYDKAIATNPTDSAYYKRSAYLTRSNKPDEALQDLNKVIELNGRFYKAYYDRATIYMAKEKYNEALGDLDKTVELKPAYTEAYTNRGIIYARQNKYSEAKRNFDKAISLDKYSEDAYTNRGIMLMDEKKYEEAINDFNKIIEMKPNSPSSLYNRARAEYSLGKKEAACADLKQAILLKFTPAEDAFNHLCH